MTNVKQEPRHNIPPDLVHGDVHRRGGEQEPGGAGADADGGDEEGDDQDAPADPGRQPVPVEHGVLEAVEALQA